MSKKPTRPKVTTRAGQIDHILSQLSADQLKTFIREKAAMDIEFRDTFLICFADLLSSGESAEPKYKQMLTDMMQRHATKDGYIGATQAAPLVNAIQQLLNAAHKATTPPRETIDLCLALISVLPQLIDKMEDVDNHCYNLLRTSCTLLWECNSILPEDRQTELFNRIVKEYGNPLYVEMDMDSFLLSLLKDWAKDKPERQAACLHQLENLLKITSSDHWRKNYFLEQTNALIAFWKR